MSSFESKLIREIIACLSSSGSFSRARFQRFLTGASWDRLPVEDAPCTLSVGPGTNAVPKVVEAGPDAEDFLERSLKARLIRSLFPITDLL